MNRSLIIAALVALAVIAGGAGIYAAVKKDKTNSTVPAANNTQPSAAEIVQPGDDSATASGNYIGYKTYSENKQRYQDNRIVYFFTSNDCLPCAKRAEALNRDSSIIGSAITIVSVDMATDAAVAQQYNVTAANTSVQVDAAGKEVKRWTDSPSTAEYLKQIQ